MKVISFNRKLVASLANPLDLPQADKVNEVVTVNLMVRIAHPAPPPIAVEYSNHLPIIMH